MLRMNKRITLVKLGIVVSACVLMPGVISIARQEKPCAGLVVEQVTPAMKTLGFQLGDVILSWKREPSLPANPQSAQGCLNSNFDLWDVTTEQLPRGPVILIGRRGSGEITWRHSEAILWGLPCRPNLTGKFLAAYEELKELAAAGKVEEGLRKLHQLAITAKEENDIPVMAFFLNLMALVNGNVGNWQQQDAAYAEGVESAEGNGDLRIARSLLLLWAWALRGHSDWQAAQEKYEKSIGYIQQPAPDSLIMAYNLDMLAAVAYNRDRWSQAEEYYRRALSIREKLVPGSLLVANTLNDLANAVWSQGKLNEADALHHRTLALREKLVPDSTDVAGSLNNIGLVAWERGEMALAEQYLTRALRLEERLTPGSVQVAGTLYNLGTLAWRYGDLSKAESRLIQALEIQRRVSPMSSDVSRTATALGGVKFDRGDLMAAEDYYRLALQIEEKLAPAGSGVATAFNNLGAIELERRDLDSAEGYLRQALEIKERIARDNVDLKDTLANSLCIMGSVMHTRGDLAEAEDFYRRALEIQRQLTMATQKQGLTDTLSSLGRIAQDRGDLQKAEDHYLEALKINENLSPEGVRVAYALRSLGDLHLDRRETPKAAEYHRHALQILERLTPGSSDLAWSRFKVGQLEQEQGHATAARGYFLGALDALESQEKKLGGAPEIRASFATGYRSLYRQVIDFLIQQGRGGEALQVVERSRARMLLNMLAERDLLFASDLPADIAEERKLTNSEYDRVQATLAELKPSQDVAKVKEMLNRLRELRAKRERIALRIRKVAPGFASLRYPQPLTVRGIRAALDSGTALLTYAVGERKTFLFLVRPDRPDPEIWTLNIEEGDLREKVNAFRNVVARRNAADLERLRAQGGELYDLLIKPVEDAIAPSSRLLISPDGPLHLLPFAALARKNVTGLDGSKGEYLIEWKPLHQIISATIYAGLTGQRREFGNSAATLVAFGDPQYGAIDAKKPANIVNADLRSAVRNGFGFTSLPSSRQEVEAIAGLYGESARMYLGPDATEERARAIGKDVRYLHFACHGLIDEKFPLNSALALTLPPNPGPGQDNGLLQAWEVFEHVRLDADLVTLSACETALGKEMGGEGLLGLTQAFQYAGARSVLASLWSVSDDSTAVLMKRFYGHLRAGKAKAEALRLAQMDMIRANENSGGTSERGFSHPFHWAAFQLIGDWK